MFAPERKSYSCLAAGAGSRTGETIQACRTRWRCVPGVLAIQDRRRRRSVRFLCTRPRRYRCKPARRDSTRSSSPWLLLGCPAVRMPRVSRSRTSTPTSPVRPRTSTLNSSLRSASPAASWALGLQQESALSTLYGGDGGSGVWLSPCPRRREAPSPRGLLAPSSMAVEASSS